MRVVAIFSCLISILLCSANGQDVSREDKVHQIESLNAQITALENDILQPAASDVQQAKSEGLEVFRLMPREKYDHKLTIQGGGAYFSFSTGSHDYQKTAQIELQQNYLSVGFAGADYGLIADLGSISLSGVSKETNEVSFLSSYKPPKLLSDIRGEQIRSGNYETETATYRSRLLVSIGHVYALRAITFDRADVLVAFKVQRKDTDGSLIIFWKMLETFSKPTIERDDIKP